MSSDKARKSRIAHSRLEQRSYGKASLEVHYADKKLEEGWLLMAEWAEEKIPCADFWPQFKEIMSEWRKLNKAARRSRAQGNYHYKQQKIRTEQ